MKQVQEKVMKISRILLILLALALLGGCIPPDQALTDSFTVPGRGAPHEARLNCFLTLLNPEGPSIRLEVAALEVLADDRWLPLNSEPLMLDSSAIGGGQLFLGGQPVPPGRYSRLRLTITKGEIIKSDGKYAVVDSEQNPLEIDLTAGLDIDLEDSRSLLLTWDVENSLLPDDSLRPVVYAGPPVRQLQEDLVFVSCPEIDTVFVVRADRNWVIDSFGLKGGPTWLAIDPTPSRQRLYVLTPRDRMVKVVDLSSYGVVDFYPAPLNDAPMFMTISPDGDAVFLLDDHGGYLSRMDTLTGRIDSRILVDFRPQYATYLEERDLLAVSLSLSQKVLLLDPVSLKVARTIPAGSSPQGMAVSEDQLYIAEYENNTVSIVDLAGRGGQSRLTVGFGPRRLMEADSQVYVSNYREGTLSVLVPGQLGVVQEIFGLGRPAEMAFNRFYRRAYVADEEAAALAVIDVNANLLLGRIFLGAKPFGLAVIQ
jgi:DNA-binding beta-propeller fold protein YncE